MAGYLLFNRGSNESSLAPQFKWLDNTFNAHHCRFHTWFLLNPGTAFPYLTSLQKFSLFAVHFKQFLGPRNRVLTTSINFCAP